MIPLPSLPKIIKEEKNKAIIEIEGLYPGYGATMGNSLRRVLLSSLEGAAITQVKIKGVSHEFSTISGVLEDVIMIILNLKKLRFKMFSEESQHASLKIKGQKEVKGKDFKLSPQIEIVNSSAHIATLTAKSAEIDMEVQIERGVGYQTVEEREIKKWDVGVLPIDAIFTPIKKVTFRVENMRVGKRTDFDRLLLDIETDGTISPAIAFSKASKIVLDHFNLFSQFEKEIEKPKEKVEKVKVVRKTKFIAKRSGAFKKKAKRKKKAKKAKK
ncbi:DNA-directed RNA polymerase subunit alpha [bacterium (Candidatus Gribaldobacteria) CG07_land_8_20_14_0_80_33_18]|uniref:DNA-directed RNA polymerase subunit alpha n=1 Tax=bacterium (Candidatus Gribaldobacteria) CG07_land_8_20_14_0_80_33_18 TaxID=2014272 RepID=A0A2M6Z3G3_9BACT|nr:MAG: DNA-directed RNA polymerase subunit alpha [bacterium (Candidatus Gribaldobacteria) CG10_big_fil_rev_8_21_14_0_10_33_41]PIU46951.1 MAG: DNA-directed RNA polymerase subunit alpha [bacterium (Candidatus Gribaldobacteria) CG07_land_8_20_14_0_80_33_18]PJA00420.1 MAG: DNA-directed RNA polymerase subunit alpha [bacterium (Candidatus Gribaldobacteria) CG_4_10_14_0_2_um_filter_33_15]PJB08094.1 MAG: DNA-directed RNA polymerase subunit alpha [bacterium (Candidatus Gribaldobacteria) CG_4_9_14_3_um_f